jgi:uncharacterized coiled-coil DUF342 family protein
MTVGFAVIVGAPLTGAGLVSGGLGSFDELVLVIEADPSKAQLVRRALANSSSQAQVNEASLSGNKQNGPWFEYNDSRLNGPVDPTIWSRVYPNSRLLCSREQAYQTLQMSLDQWAAHWTSNERLQAIQLGGKLVIRQGDPLAILSGTGEWIDTFSEVVVDIPSADLIWGEAIDNVLREQDFSRQTAGITCWQRDIRLSRIKTLDRRIEQLIKENAALLQERETLHADRAQLVQERDILAAKKDHMSSELQAVHAQKDHILAKQEELALQRDGIAAERDALIISLDERTAARDQLSLELEKISLHRDQLAASQQELIHQRDALSAEKDHLSSELQAVHAQKDHILAKQEELALQRDGIAAERDALIISLDERTTARDQLSLELEKMSIHRDQLAASQRDLITTRDRLINEVSDLQSEKKDYLPAKDQLQARIEATISERDQAIQHAEALSIHRDQLVASQQELMEERDRLIASIDTLKQTNSELSKLTHHSEDHLAYIKDLFVQITTGRVEDTEISKSHRPSRGSSKAEN